MMGDLEASRGTSERCPSPHHSQDRSAEDHPGENLTDIIAERVLSEEDTCTLLEEQERPAETITNGPEKCPGPHYSDSSEDDHPRHHDQAGTDRETEGEEEMDVTSERPVKGEELPADVGTDGEAKPKRRKKLYRSATTSRTINYGTDCDKVPEEYDQAGEKQFICTECGKGFSLYSYLTKHQRSHSGEKPYTCTECGKCFTYKPSLVSHQRVHTGEKPFSCSECGKLFASKFNLKTHEKIHSGDKPVGCPACGKCFSNNPALVKHLRIHTGEKPFSCSDCGKFFSSKSGLNAHLILHTGEKPFMCAECGKSFANQSNLISHRIIHTGVKPYVCSECGKGFANQSNLAKHKIIHTEEKPFLCMECGKFFTRKGSLDKHRQRIHEKGKMLETMPFL